MNAGDGSHSEVRKALGTPFEGFTWPERFLVIDTPFDLRAAIPGLESVTYVAAPTNWRFLLQLPSMWRVILPIAQELPDATPVSRVALRSERGDRLMGRLTGAGADYLVLDTPASDGEPATTHMIPFSGILYITVQSQPSFEKTAKDGPEPDHRHNEERKGAIPQKRAEEPQLPQ